MLLQNRAGGVSQDGAGEKQEPETRKEQISYAFPSNIFIMTQTWICSVFCSSAASSDSQVRHYTSIRAVYIQIHLLYYPVKYESFSYMSNLKIFMFMQRCKITKFIKSTIL